MSKEKLRKSYLYLANDNDLKIYQYQVMPKSPFIKGTLRSSWFSLDTTQESLDDMITTLMESYIENKGLELTLGSNPCERYLFKYNELKEIIIDVILAKNYFKLVDEVKDLEDKLLDKEIEVNYSNLSSYGHKSEQIGLYKELLKNRDYSNKFNTYMFNYIQADAIKEFKRIRDNKTVEQLKNKETIKSID